jgi:DNA processing protein
VHQPGPESVRRYALLLAGARAAHRRALADGGEPDEELATVRQGPSLLARARELEAEVPERLARLAERGWQWLVPSDPRYPAGVAALADPPLGLLVRGRLAEGPAAAVVGSRRATPYGLQVARLLAAELASAGVAVVSGMARGVDAAAHRATLEAAGETLAVWGTGPDRVYPAEHRRLAEAIAASGGLVTEHPPGTPPRPGNFPQRNRIVVGLVSAVVVVEAAARSGALITARVAADEGRDVLAVPGSILSDLSVGPNALIRMGAAPVLGVGDVLAELGLEAWGRAASGAASEDADDPLLAAVPPGEAVTIDDVVAATGQPAAAVLSRLLELELAGRLERSADGRYCRK